MYVWQSTDLSVMRMLFISLLSRDEQKKELLKGVPSTQPLELKLDHEHIARFDVCSSLILARPLSHDTHVFGP